MNKIKVIDLLNMISKGEEVPKKIKFRNTLYTLIEYGISTRLYQSIEPPYEVLEINTTYLNDEIEIVEDVPKEEKKIPEKLYLYEETQNIIRENNYKLVYHDIHKCIVSLECKYNQLIDYLKSKGE